MFGIITFPAGSGASWDIAQAYRTVNGRESRQTAICIHCTLGSVARIQIAVTLFDVSYGL